MRSNVITFQTFEYSVGWAMQPFTLTVKNYRCFDDQNPLRLDISPGFTALVGSNNSGKSSLLKFFYEFRPTFSALRGEGNLNSIAGSAPVGINYLGLDDPYEIFHNRNQRLLSLEFDFPKATHSQIKSLRLNIDRTQPTHLRGELFLGNGNQLLRQVGMSGANPPTLIGYETTGGEQLVDFSTLFEVCDAISGSVYVGAFRNAINEGGRFLL